MKIKFTSRTSKLLATSAFILSLSACAYDEAAYKKVQDDGNDSVRYVLADEADISTFYQALVTTGVADELNNDTVYTIFAPTNAAFAEIRQRDYPCFYATQCREQVAAILRNHIVPRNDNITRLSKWGGDIKSIGTRNLDIIEDFKGKYKVDNHRVLYQNNSNGTNYYRGSVISLYRIDGVIVSDQELEQFKTMPLASAPNVVTEKTVTTYNEPSPHYVFPQNYLIPGGYSIGYTNVMPENTRNTTTITRTTTTQ